MSTTLNKKCIKCDKVIDISKFHIQKKSKYGVRNTCKKCVSIYSKLYRINNIEKIKEYDNNRPNRLERIEYNKLISKTDHGKMIKKKCIDNYNSKFPEKMIARRMVSNGIRDGKITKKPCSICGDKKSQAHHDDYSKPLDIVFLCDIHHKERHRSLKLKFP